MSDFFIDSSVSFDSFWIAIALISVFAIGAFATLHYQHEKGYQSGLARGLFDFDGELIKARNDSYSSGYKAAIEDIKKSLSEERKVDNQKNHQLFRKQKIRQHQRPRNL